MARRGLSGSRGRGKEEEGGEARARRWRRMMRRGGGKGGEKDKGFLGRNVSLVYVSSHPCRYNSAANVNVLFPKREKLFLEKKAETRGGARQRNLTRWKFQFRGSGRVEWKGGRAFVVC